MTILIFFSKYEDNHINYNVIHGACIMHGQLKA
jgi:hypothetical protein